MRNRFGNILHAGLWAAITVSGLFCSGCKVDDAEVYDKSELGAATKEYKIEAGRGSVEVKVLANEQWTASFTSKDIDWAEIENPAQEGDGVVKINVEPNDHFARMALLRIVSGDRADTVRIKQKGAMTPELSFANPSITVPGKGGQVRTRFATNIDMEDIKVDILYTSSDEGDWINSYEYANGYLFFDCGQNISDFTRNARVTMKYIDGWGETLSSTLYQTQANKDEELGTLIGFDEARDLAGIPVTRDVFIQGYIVSSSASLNAGECLQNTATAIDYTPPQKTAYIESLDGRYGFRLVCKTAADNIFEQYGKVSLLLKGATILPDDDPAIRSFYITGVESQMVMEAEKGTAASLPVKEKYMSELTDDDIYTYVTLKDCEFPVRKGGLSPVNEGYTSLYAVNRLAKYPTLIRDIKGESMYLMLNINTPFRRDGSKLPEGSGKLRGVISHETFTRFSYQDTDDPTTYGQIGRYQLRPQSYSDIFGEIAADFNQGFSAMAFEMRYAHVENNRALPTTDGMSGYITTTSIDPKATVYGTGDWSYLGPCGSKYTHTEADGKTGLGFGLLSIDGGDNFKITLIGGGNVGKGNVTEIKGSNPLLKLMPALATTYAWNYDDPTDGEEGSADGFLVCFSTKDISTDNLSMQLSVVNQADNTPRWWKVEWSEGGTKQDKWHSVGTYTTAMTENWSSSQIWNLSAPKNLDMPLPLELLGRENVYLRLIPELNQVSSYLGYINPGVKIGSGNCSLCYIGIRYNK